MDNDLSHAALIRFDNLNERLTYVEQQLGINTGEDDGDDQGEDQQDSGEEGAYPIDTPAPATTSKRGRKSQTTTVEDQVEDTTTVSEY